MKTESGFTLMSASDFKPWLNNKDVKRTIKNIQIHHTYAPSYSSFDGKNWFILQKNMRNYHVNNRGFQDIAQHFTIFPDGKICTGRSLDTIPAGIAGANTGGICIENLGNFDVGGDDMTDEQAKSIVEVVRCLLSKFGLNAETSVVYHCWYDSSGRYLGDYKKNKSAKTCPGTNFFGGNTRRSFEDNLLPYLKGEKTMISKEEVKKMIKEAIPQKKIYNKINEMPEWASPTIRKLIDENKLFGDERGNLNLSEDMIRLLVVINR